MAFALPTLLPHQELAKDFIVDRPHCGIFLGIGGMKAQPLSAAVLTPTGFITMGQARPGTVVVTPDGDRAPIRSIHPQGVRPVFAVVLGDGRTVEADAEHLWVVANAKDRQRGLRRTMTTEQLAADLQMANGSPKWAIEACSAVDLGTWSSDLDPYLLGVLLGDGGLTGGSPTLSNPEAPIVEAVRELLPDGVDAKPTGSGCDYYLTRSGSASNRENPLTARLRSLGLFGLGSGDKFVPAHLLHSSVADRLALLQGLADTDANVHGSSFCFDLKSRRLAEDAAWLVHSLGGRAALTEMTLRTGPYAGNLYHRVIARLPNSMSPFRHSAKKARIRPHNDGRRRSYEPMFTSIASIEQVREEEVQCILVDHPSHQYVTDGFVRTHNTLTTLAALAQVRPAGHILVIAPLSIARSVWLDEIEKWGFPLRTRSLIVDENDRQLSREDRLAGFQQVFSDPPTMYFVNRELLTQPPATTSMVVPAAVGSVGADAPEHAAELLDAVRSLKAITADDLVDHHRERELAQGAARPTAKARLKAALKHLESTGLVARARFDCARCDGRGCQECQFGLIDQMPVKTIGGKRTIMWPFPTVVIDESQGFKDPSSNRFKAMRKVRPAISRLVQLTGTPAPQSLLDLWAQMYLIDQGATLGNYSAYRAKYFVPTVHVDNRPVKWEIMPGAEAEIYKAVAPYVMSAQNTSLPPIPVSINEVNVTLPKPVMEAYREFAREQVLMLAMPDPNDPRRLAITADNAAVLAGKLTQFASGTIYTGEDHAYAVTHREKLAVLEHLVANATGSVLVAYRFIAEKRELMAHLAKRGHRVEAFDGSREMVRRWNAGAIPVMVVHPASAGPGLNLQDGGHTLIWHTLPESLEHYEQLNGRLVRPGQANHVQIHALVAKGTRDAGAPRRLAIKAQVQQGLISAVELRSIDPMTDFDDLLGDLDIDPF